MGEGTKGWPSMWLRVKRKARIAKKCNNTNISGKVWKVKEDPRK